MSKYVERHLALKNQQSKCVSVILRIKINSVSSAGSWVENPGYSTIRSLRKRPQLADVVDIPPGRGASVGDGNLLMTADKSLDGRSGH